MRPDAPHYSIDDYFRKNFDPGVFAFFREELGFTDEEMDEEFRFWQEFVRTRVPKAYDGIREILRRHRANGGVIAVVSHSTRGEHRARLPRKRAAHARPDLRLGAARGAAQSRIRGRWRRSCGGFVSDRSSCSWSTI